MGRTGKPYVKPAIIGTTKVDPKPDSCQQGDEASVPGPTQAGQSPQQRQSTGKPAGRGQLKVVRDDSTGK